MVAKGQMAGAESAPRTPLVAEEMAAVVAMAEGVWGGGAQEVWAEGGEGPGDQIETRTADTM